VRNYAQDVHEEVYSQLQAGDLLMIDSSHSVKTGSEVIRIYLDIIPSLAAGVFVHIHDVFLPYAYSRTVLNDYYDWQETTLLTALLTGNDCLRVLCCQSALHYARPDELRSVLSSYRPQRGSDGLGVGQPGDFPASMWLRTAER
jgi:hypothetical protein